MRREFLIIFGALVLLFAGLIVTVGRTDVVSDTLGSQIEAQFAESFYGSLSIGSIEANLWKQISITDLVFYDEIGRPWLSIDSLVATPYWRALVSRRFEIHKLEVIHPSLTLYEDSTRGLHFPAVLRRRNRANTEQQWVLESAQIEILDGLVTTSLQDPESQELETLVLDRLHFDNLAAKATLDWKNEVKEIELKSLSASTIDPDLVLHDISATLNITEDSLHLPQLNLQFGGTHLRARGFLERGGQSWSAALDTATVDFPELQRLFPIIPLDTVIHASGNTRGSEGKTQIDQLSLRWKNSVLNSDLTLTGNRDSLEATAVFASSVLTLSDLKTLIPGNSLAPWVGQVEPIHFEGLTQATMVGNSVLITAETSGQIEQGSFELSTEIASQEALSYDIRLSGNQLKWLSEETILSGDVHLAGSGTTMENLNTSLDGRLWYSTIAGRPLDSMRVDFTVSSETADFAIDAHHKQESIELSGSTAWPDVAEGYGIILKTRNLDLGQLLRDDSLNTSVSAELLVEGTGTSLSELNASFKAHLVETTIHRGLSQLPLPENQFEGSLEFLDSDSYAIAIDGDIFSIKSEVVGTGSSLSSVFSLWSSAARFALEREGMKRYQGGNQTVLSSDESWPPPALLTMQNETYQSLVRDNQKKIALTADIDVHEPEFSGELLGIFGVRIPNLFPVDADTVQTAFSTNLSLSADADSLAFELNLIEIAEAGFAARSFFDFALDSPSGEHVNGGAIITAPKVDRVGITVANPELRISFRNNTAHINLRTGVYDQVGPISLRASISSSDDRYVAIIHEGTIFINNQEWQLTDPTPMDLFWNAAELLNLTMKQAGPPDQQLSVGGLIATGNRTSISADLTDLSLEQLSALVGMRRPFGGYADGTLHWSVENGLIGHVTVDTLIRRGRTWGRIEAVSRVMPRTTDISLDVGVIPLSRPSVLAPSLSVNAASINGTMRLQSPEDPGNLDLDLDIRQLDAVILEDILSFVGVAKGAMRGVGTFSGTPQDIEFEADLGLQDLSFTVPRYDLEMTSEGILTVNNEGVHTESLILRDSTGGRAEVRGSVLFNEYRFISFDMSGSVNRMQIMNRPAFTRELPWYGTVWASGDLTLTGPLDNVNLTSNNIRTTRESELLIPIRESVSQTDPSFILYRDASVATDVDVEPVRRANILSQRPENERRFGSGMVMDLAIEAPEGSTIKLVIDPLLGDVITGIGSARIQIQRVDGEMLTYGTFTVTGGDYLFTAGEVFVRRFLINDGTIQWNGPPLDPILDIRADYRTRASRSGLPEDVGGTLQTSLPLIVDLHITGPLNAVQVDLSLTLDQRQEAISDTPLLEAYLNQSDRAAQHASSVLLTNSFLLSTEGTRSDVLTGSALNSVSQLVTSQLNRYLSQVVPNADFAFGVLSDETAEDLDLSAGIALRLLDERLLIRGQGIYRGQQVDRSTPQGLEGEFVVEIRLGPSISLDLFHRREGDVLSETLITRETGVGLNYRTQFSSWRDLWQDIFRADPDSLDTARR